MPTAAIIGASRGIGLGLVEKYASEGWRVHATTRTPERPGALGEVAGDVHIHGLEVTDRPQQRALREALEDEAVDVLIHNAGVYGRGMRAAAVNRINAEAPIEVAESADGRGAAQRSAEDRAHHQHDGRAPRLHPEPREVRRLQGRAQRPVPRDRGELARAGLPRGRHPPGWVRTDMGGRNAAVSVEESARGIFDLMASLDESGHGRFWTWEGREHPW